MYEANPVVFVVDDDPVVFALKDRVSWLTIGAIGVIMLLAI